MRTDHNLTVQKSDSMVIALVEDIYEMSYSGLFSSRCEKGSKVVCIFSKRTGPIFTKVSRSDFTDISYYFTLRAVWAPRARHHLRRPD